MTRALLLVTSLTAVTARPHVHGILENIRRLVHPPSTNVSHTHVPATFSLSGNSDHDFSMPLMQD